MCLVVYMQFDIVQKVIFENFIKGGLKGGLEPPLSKEKGAHSHFKSAMQLHKHIKWQQQQQLQPWKCSCCSLE